MRIGKHLHVEQSEVFNPATQEWEPCVELVRLGHSIKIPMSEIGRLEDALEILRKTSFTTT